MPSPSAIRPRAYLIGIPLVGLLCVLSVYADMSAMVIQFGVLQFSPPAVAALFLLSLVNAIWSRKGAEPPLRRSEMLVIYAMVLVGIMVATRGVIEKVLGTIAYLPYAIANTDPRFAPYLSHIPRWIVPFNPSRALPPPEVVTGFYNGNSSVPWNAWLRPVGADFALIGGMVIIFLGMATILRRQWSDVEHLSYPLATLPIALIDNVSDGQPLLSNSYLWYGIAFSAFVFGLKGLAANIPGIPNITTSIDFTALTTAAPWNAIPYTRAYISLAVIGFAYFIPGDILLSMWLFYLLYLFQPVVASMYGSPPNVSSIWPAYESAGAYFVIAAATFWQARRHLAQTFSTAFGNRKNGARLEDSSELMTYRNAYLSIAGGFAGVLVWMLASGMSLWLALVQIVIYVFVVVVVMSRAVAQAGLMMTETSFLPQSIVSMFVPLQTLGAANLTMLTVTDTFFAQDLRGELLAPFMDTQRTASGVGEKPRTLLGPLLLGCIISCVVASIAFLMLNYSKGGILLYDHPHAVYNYEMSLLIGPMQGQPTQSSPAAFVIGAALAILLTVARAKFEWFPLHPLGPALCACWSMKVFWLGFAIAWAIRGLIVKYGGVSMFRRFAPFMFGLIIGEFTSAVFWACLHMAYGVSTPDYPWP